MFFAQITETLFEVTIPDSSIAKPAAINMTIKPHIRNNSEWAERGDVWSFKAMLDDPSLEGQRPLPDTTRTVAHIFKSQGYKTGMVGKWGLGAPNTNSIPNKMGFDFFYGYNCQRQAHTYYPTHLWKNQEREYLDNYIVDKKQALKELFNCLQIFF